MIFVLYHAGCCDGFASALAAWLIYGTDRARYIPVRYQEPVPEFNDISAEHPGEIVIVDFSYPREVLLALADRPDISKVTVIDHHAPAAETLIYTLHPKLTVCFDELKSGAVLTWEWLHPKLPVPELFQFVQDYDLHSFKLPETMAVYSGIWRATKRKFEDWAVVLSLWNQPGPKSISAKDQLLIGGRAINQADDQLLYILEKNAVEITGPNGEPGLSVNTPTLTNGVADRILANRPEIQFVMVWNDSGGFRRVSLRSRPDGCNVEPMAKLHGGGGHRSASGYRYPCPAPVWTSGQHG